MERKKSENSAAKDKAATDKRTPAAWAGHRVSSPRAVLLTQGSCFNTFYQLYTVPSVSHMYKNIKQ